MVYFTKTCSLVTPRSQHKQDIYIKPQHGRNVDVRKGGVITFLMTAEPQLPGPALQATAETAYSVFDEKPFSEQVKGPEPAFISQAWLESPALAVTSNL